MGFDSSCKLSPGEMSNPVFWEKIRKTFQNVVCLVFTQHAERYQTCKHELSLGEPTCLPFGYRFISSQGNFTNFIKSLSFEKQTTNPDDIFPQKPGFSCKVSPL